VSPPVVQLTGDGTAAISCISISSSMVDVKGREAAMLVHQYNRLPASTPGIAHRLLRHCCSPPSSTRTGNWMKAWTGMLASWLWCNWNDICVV
jgi:hypothetical protein